MLTLGTESGAPLPTHDWQFWVVTALFVVAVFWLGRSLAGLGSKVRSKPRSTRVSLTIDRKPPNSHEQP